MELVTVNNGSPVTTSLALAEGLEVEHASIIKLVRGYQGDLETFGRVGFEIVPFETAGGTQSREIAILNERHATLIMTYAKNTPVARQFKTRLVVAFYKLAQQAQNPLSLLNDPAAMRTMLLNYTEKVLELEDTVNTLAPKAAALDQLENSEGYFNLTTAAKTLNIPPQKFINDLQRRQWIYRMGVTGSWTGHQQRVNGGDLTHKIYRQELPDGSEKARAQVLVTPKGMAKLSMIYLDGI